MNKVGNPNIRQYSFTPRGEKTKTAQILIRVDAEVKDSLEEIFGDEKSEFIRSLISKAIAEIKEKHR
jgi:hypothetical protein